MTNPASNAVSNAADLLEQRARRLARRAASDTAPVFAIDVLQFSVAREKFAIESRFVFAVFRLAELVPLPGAQAPVVGVTRWRGDVLTVLDLRRVVGGSARALDDLARVIVVGSTSAAFGVLADTAEEISSLDPTALHSLSAERHLEIPGVLRGVTAGGVHVLDAAVLIAHQDSDLNTPSNVVSPPTNRQP